jgi:D-aminopeptidase
MKRVGARHTALILVLLITAPVLGQDRGRLRDYGVRPGVLPPGPLNAITDVGGVRVGHVTLRQGTSINTGVTAIVPHDGNIFDDKPPAAIFVANGFGKLTGISQVKELGNLETPILLTGTLSVPRAADALISYMLALPGNEEVRSINPVVGETNDGFLSDIRARPIRPEHVTAAIDTATGGVVEEGSIGAGTGTIAFGFKGGIGTASRRLPAGLGGWTVGALVQTNFGGVLQIAGAPVGIELGQYYMRSLLESAARSPRDIPDGSCMIVVATDAPLDAAALERLALRAFMGMARTGAAGSNGSGDYVIAFSTHPGLRQGRVGSARPRVTPLPPSGLSPLFMAAIEAAEEAIYNSLFAATTVTGPRGEVPALDIEATVEIIRGQGRPEQPDR